MLALGQVLTTSSDSQSTSQLLAWLGQDALAVLSTAVGLPCSTGCVPVCCCGADSWMQDQQATHQRNEMMVRACAVCLSSTCAVCTP